MLKLWKVGLIVTLAITTLFLVDCHSKSNGNVPSKVSATIIDSCDIALKFENAKVAELMVDKEYTGELNNYWGDDETKLDVKHIFKKGKLVKSYFYYKSQAIQEEYSFKCGALHGQQKWYFENGKVEKTISYSYGYRNGVGMLYDKDGYLTQKVDFQNDSIIGEIQKYDKSGKLLVNDTISKQ